ncbi:preprotein translocase subunit SecY [Deinococcus yavapaiensis]|uniref:Protein translocase subunit SecY n=1 Tax=Deinococcus yavapaiensis KR-236 TaxID=694435 RepID=A0A318SFY9_9DEIO|nr:preprotein translocase subunit SecY [Deinococcus yavapaiensis]PYE48134.1 protein translocase subunit secY/sec61 alpha [Deinococcus yavapaiensis KR-236]
MLRAFRDALRVPELQRKILFTLLLLMVFRLGSAIPTPGINSAALQDGNNAVLGLLSVISGGNLQQFSIFALGVLPYITASIVIQLLTTTVPALEKLQKEGEEGRRRINQYTRYSAVVLGAVQALIFSVYIINSNPQALSPGWGPTFDTVLIMVLTQVAGIAFTMWLGERITEIGLGNGISLIIFAGIVSRYPIEISSTAELLRTGAVSALAIVAFVAILLIVIGGIVFVYQGERRVPVQYARKQVGGKTYGGQQTYLPIKVNQAGVIPVIFASAIFTLPQLLSSTLQQRAPDVAAFITRYLTLGSPTGILLEVLLIFGFTYLYNSIQFDGRRVAENLRESGGFIPGVRPGAPTAQHLSFISSRISLWGALFLALLTIMPQVVRSVTGIQSFQFTGTGLLIVVGVALDTLKQLEAQLTVRRYDGFISKGRLRGRL